MQTKRLYNIMLSEKIIIELVEKIKLKYSEGTTVNEILNMIENDSIFDTNLYRISTTDRNFYISDNDWKTNKEVAWDIVNELTNGCMPKVMYLNEFIDSLPKDECSISIFKNTNYTFMSKITNLNQIYDNIIPYEGIIEIKEILDSSKDKYEIYDILINYLL